MLAQENTFSWLLPIIPRPSYCSTDSDPVHTNAFPKRSVFVLLKTHRILCVHISVFIAFLNIHTKTRENAYKTWFDVLVKLRMPEWTTFGFPLTYLSESWVANRLREPMFNKRLNDAILSSKKAIKQGKNIKNISIRSSVLFVSNLRREAWK